MHPVTPIFTSFPMFPSSLPSFWGIPSSSSIWLYLASLDIEITLQRAVLGLFHPTPALPSIPWGRHSGSH
ncbi:hypothetical protein XENTR_v10003082 [Xenopus tropicalis]|nr:hypothetical protein XENTR_v10003082 [Xenopus tropicalis]